MPMNEFLAEHYGTTKTAASQEEQEKEASVELFLKLAADQKIDLASMPDAQVQDLYNRWKTAAAEEPKKEDDKKVKEEARKEHEEKKAYAEKIAEADFLGRVMAHSYAQELRNIAAAGGEKVAGEMPEAFRKGPSGEKDKEPKKDEKDEKKDKEASALLRAVRAKQASAIDKLAAEHAVKLAREANLDADEAGRKVAAVLILNLAPESTKVASAPDLASATHVRALELLEKAGYPINWGA